MREYLARAVVEFGAFGQWDHDDGPPKVWPQLPVEVEPFRLDVSPNSDIYFGEIFGIDPEQMAHLKVDWDYPVSPFYVDTHLEMPDRESPIPCADERFNRFELLLRLFQPGDVSVRRHSFVRDVRGGAFWIEFGGNAVKSRVMTRYERPPYPLNDAALGEFTEFLDEYWGMLEGLDRRVKRGLSRFSSSYERRELEDRLIDLVIALEALFNDSESDSVSFKIAIRCAGWLYPPGEQRVSLFRFIKRIYKFRSAAVHGRKGKRKEPTTENLDQLECVVRASVMKFLDHQKSHQKTLEPKDLDEMMMSGRF